MHIIERLAKDKIDDMTHKKLSRYGKGEFFLSQIRVKSTPTRNTARASEKYATYIGSIVSNYLDDGEYKIKGNIISLDEIDSYLDKKEIEYTKKKQKKGGQLHTYKIQTNLDKKIIKKIYDEIKDVSEILLSYGTRQCKIKTKPNLSRPSMSGKIANPMKFCSATLPKEARKDLADLLLFDFDNKEFKEINIEDNIVVDRIEIPDEAKDLSFAKKRLLAKRCGKLIRKIEIDSKEITKEYKISA